MNKRFLILSFIAIAVMNLNSKLKSMEQKPSPMELDQASSLWAKLPYELQQIVLSKVALEKAGSTEEILAKLNELGKNSLFSNVVNDNVLIANLAKKYIEKNQEKVNDELYNALKKGKKEVVKALILAGTDVNGKLKFGYTPLLGAVDGNHKEIVEIVLDAGANVNAISEAGTPPLNAAHDKDIAQLLLKSGADINAKDSAGNTALLMATMLANKNMVEFLLANGADPNIRNIQGETALMAAERRIPLYIPWATEKLKQIVDILKNFGK